MDAGEQSRAERERTFFDGAPETRRHRVDKFYVLAARSTREYNELLSSPGGRVLELGCGDGSAALEIAGSGADVVAIDISERRIASATAAHGAIDVAGSVSFQVMNAEQLEFDDAVFDLVCGKAILHHLDLRRTLPEVARTLKPDGRAVFIEPLGHNPLINFYRRLTPSLRSVDEAPLTTGDLELARAYFGDVELSFFHLTSLAAVPVVSYRVGRSILEALESFDRLLFRTFPQTQRFAWRVVLQLRSPRMASAPPGGIS